jgi:hypothetical protein
MKLMTVMENSRARMFQRRRLGAAFAGTAAGALGIAGME